MTLVFTSLGTSFLDARGGEALGKTFTMSQGPALLSPLVFILAAVAAGSWEPKGRPSFCSLACWLSSISNLISHRDRCESAVSLTQPTARFKALRNWNLLSFQSDLRLVAAGLLSLPLGFKLHGAATKLASWLFPWGLVWISESRDKIMQSGNALNQVKWGGDGVGDCHQTSLAWFLGSFYPCLCLTKADWFWVWYDPYHTCQVFFFSFRTALEEFALAFRTWAPFLLPPSLACSPCLLIWEPSPSSFPPICLYSYLLLAPFPNQPQERGKRFC